MSYIRRATFIALSFSALTSGQATDFGYDPQTEVKKLERGDLKFLERISLRHAENLQSYIQRNKIHVIHELSNVACFDRSIGNQPAGCTISINISLNPQVSNLCTTLLRWHQDSKGGAFQPDSGMARILISNPASVIPSVRDSEARCMRPSR